MARRSLSEGAVPATLKERQDIVWQVTVYYTLGEDGYCTREDRQVYSGASDTCIIEPDTFCAVEMIAMTDTMCTMTLHNTGCNDDILAEATTDYYTTEPFAWTIIGPGAPTHDLAEMPANARDIGVSC